LTRDHGKLASGRHGRSLGEEDIVMQDQAIEQELARVERAYWQAMKDRDVDAMLRLTDESCVVAGAQGAARLEKKMLASMLKAPSWTLERFELKDLQVLILRDDVAVVAYKVHEELIVDGKPVSFDAADASTWIRRDGQWLCALHTESLAGDPFGRDRVGSH
jgi:uncharacterized protein (TIGR02246 family)